MGHLLMNCFCILHVRISYNAGFKKLTFWLDHPLCFCSRVVGAVYIMSKGDWITDLIFQEKICVLFLFSAKHRSYNDCVYSTYVVKHQVHTLYYKPIARRNKVLSFLSESVYNNQKPEKTIIVYNMRKPTRESKGSTICLVEMFLLAKNSSGGGYSS